ncbi:MAG TPA: ABC transporter ATP-binding protein, partial [Chitinophagaceae bacterium]|nr:ABC transporter ATP-binding protein [Chitinophagaceae bacterium]
MISVQKLNKSYAQQQVLHTLNFAIAKGECYGLLGPNGAGKSTTVGILCGMTNPDSGEVTLGTYSLPKQAPDAKKIIGLVPQEIALYQELSPEDNLLFWGGLYQLSKREIQEQSDYWLKRFGLYEKRTQKIKTFSGGMKRRVNIASALMHRPSILFMDEPTVGVDPQSRNLIYEVIQELKNSGMTILYTTHYMEEAERFCDRIGIIDKGHLIAEGTLNELRQ